MNPLGFYKCLADETRLRALLLIASEQELCVCELVTALDDIQPKISRHLAQLRQCGLLQDRRQGQWVFYRLHPDLANWAQQVLMITAKANQDFIDQAADRLANMRDRPERAALCC